MMVYSEKIPPPLPPPTDEERNKLRLEAIEREDRWVKSFIDHLAGTARDSKQP
jgi:hypothetical protein